MLDNLNYGYQGNQMFCACGKHQGIGVNTAEQRAALAGRMRDVMPQFLSEETKRFIADWERFHGSIQYVMGTIGVNSGEFVKGNKGSPLRGPIYQENQMLVTYMNKMESAI